MRSENISDAMGLIDDELIATAEKSRKQKKRKKRHVLQWIAAAACICFAVTGILESRRPIEAFAIAKADYPEMVSYPDYKAFVDENGRIDWERYNPAYNAWCESRYAQSSQAGGEYKERVKDFAALTAKQLLRDTRSGNLIYSPLNTYVTLGMLAEMTDGSSRRQILDVLGQENVESLRTEISSLWNINYCNDGAFTSILANSVWLDQDVDFDQPVMDVLAENYYASSYQGKMGSENLNRTQQEWMKEQTDGLGNELLNTVGFDGNTEIALMSAVNFQAKWIREFSESETSEGTFHGAEGDVICNFMHQREEQSYFKGEQFSAVGLLLKDVGRMWLLLPDENITIEELLLDQEAEAFYTKGGESIECDYRMVNLSMPKFQISSELDLKDELSKWGVKDVFDKQTADFSPMTDDRICLSEVCHTACVFVDEKGCSAEACIDMTEGGMGGGDRKDVDFVLDRPFLFVITGQDGLPFLLGVVNQPVE